MDLIVVLLAMVIVIGVMEYAQWRRERQWQTERQLLLDRIMSVDYLAYIKGQTERASVEESKKAVVVPVDELIKRLNDEQAEMGIPLT